MLIAICFFGLTRSLKITIDSINKNIFESLKKQNHEYKIFLHTYNLKKIINDRTGENNILDVEEYKLLNPDFFEITNQDDFDKFIEIDKYVKNGLSHTYTETTIMNILRQNNSIFEVWKLVKQSNINFDLFMMCRPDLEYLQPIYIPDIKFNTLYIPNFAHFGGLNDRFCVGDMASVDIWCSRLDNIEKYSEKNILQSEQYLKYTLNQNKINVRFLNDFKFRRIRANGKVEAH